MTAYQQGLRVEHAVVHDLTDHGYDCVRAASSKGVADVVAIKPGEILLINCKRASMPGPGERLALWSLRWETVVPIVALKPARRALQYRRLTGPGPRDWAPWAPDLP